MNIRTFYGKIDDNYAWELEWFYKGRDLSDGLDAFKFDLSWERYAGDHNPQFNFSLILLNFVVFDFTIYNIWHVDHPRSPFFRKDVDSPNYEKDNHE